MKKLYILFIMFGLFFVPYVETQAYTINSLDEKLIVSKNLFDGTYYNEYFVDSNVFNYSSGSTNLISVIASVESGETYTTSKPDGAGTRFRVAYTNEYPIQELDIPLVSAPILNDTGTIITSTAPINANYMVVYISNDGTTPRIQIELGSTATSYEPYYNLSLREVFEDGNVMPQTLSEYDSQASAIDDDGFWYYDLTLGGISVSKNYTADANDVFYGNHVTKNASNATRQYQIRLRDSLNNNGLIYTFEIIDIFTNQSYLITNTIDIVRIEWVRGATGDGFIYVKDNQQYLINLTSLNLYNKSKNEMDYWFNEYQKMLAYNEGFTDTTTYQTGYNTGFEFGYNTGYTDAVTEDNAYSLGYALGLQEGQDMETGSSIIVLVLALMAFAMMLFGFTSKRRIFNLFASGLFIALGAILFEYPAFIIVTIGLVIVNVYYTFVSD